MKNIIRTMQHKQYNAHKNALLNKEKQNEKYNTLIQHRKYKTENITQ